MTAMAARSEPRETVPPLSPRIARMKERMLTSPYEICLARARFFTDVYRETEGMDPHRRNALALERTLARQKIRIEPDEQVAGSKTEKFLAGPLSVERGDFLRSLQVEIRYLDRKNRPFLMSDAEKRLFREYILPYWDRRTLRDRKARAWEEKGLIERESTSPFVVARHLRNVRAFTRYVDPESLRKMIAATARGGFSLRGLKTAHEVRYELARNNPTWAIYCFDVQGHLVLGVDKVVREGMGSIIAKARRKIAEIEKSEPENKAGLEFLKSVIVSLESAIAYAHRHADLTETMARQATDPAERKRLDAIARHLKWVPEKRPRTFHEAVQAVWIAQVVGEIQYGTHDVLAIGRADQYLYPLYRKDIDSRRLTREEAIELIQELNLKLTANVEPVPEAGAEANATMGVSQHNVTIGGVDAEGNDATNELSYLMLDAYEGMNGCINQLSVRVHDGSPKEFIHRAAEVFRRTSGHALFGDNAIVKALVADGCTLADAREYSLCGCIETSPTSNAHVCPGGHEICLPVVLVMALTDGRYPPPMIGQMAGAKTGLPASFRTYGEFVAAFRRQFSHQVKTLVDAVAGKDRAYMEFLPAPYVSALMDDCVARAKDMTRGGAKYDFTSIDVRGLATLADSILAIRKLVYERKECTIEEMASACLDNFEGREALRQKCLNEVPKFGSGDKEAEAMAIEIIGWLDEEARKYRNERGGRYRVAVYSYGNHVLDGFFLGATPDGRRRGEPVSNGVSPSNKRDARSGPLAPLLAVAKFPPEKISSGISLNMKFHPSFIRSENGLDAFASMLSTYFRLGGMHVQPNVVSNEVLRDAQAHPERYRDLVVKVAGYSAYFTDLGRSIQEDIIERTEFGAEGG